MNKIYPNWVDLNFECNKLKSASTDDRIKELTNELPPTSLIAVGGFPLVKSYLTKEFYWCNNLVTPDNFSFLIKEALGLSAVLTYVNRSNKSLSDLGDICANHKHYWGLHWINITIMFSKHNPKVELAFARDTRFHLSWPVQESPTGELFTATAGLKEWLDYTNHRNDLSFDLSTRQAMNEAFAIIKELTPWI